MSEVNDELLAALRAIVSNSTYETPGGYENCRFCDNNMDHEGTFKDMHDPDCEIRKAKIAIAKAEGRS